MERTVRPARMGAMILFVSLLLTLVLINLYRVQVVERDKYTQATENTVTSRNIVPAARGNVYDRYGRLMVNNRTCNNLVIDTDELFEQPDPNGIILQLVRAVEESGGRYTDQLPVTKSAPFNYISNMTNIQRQLLDGYLDAYDLPASTTAVELMAVFRDKFNIDNNYTSEETRIIAGVRYELRVRYIVPTSDYVFAEDVSMDLITQLMEQGVPGFRVVSSFVREYNTNAAAHVLGYIGSMYADEVDEYTKIKKYPMNAQVGKAGIEKAFEDYLHGVDGEAIVTSTKGGTVLSTNYTKDVLPGNNVFVTLDVGLQETAEASLAGAAESINARRRANNAQYEGIEGYEKKLQQMVPAAALVAVDVRAGEPLAIASYPTFDISKLMDPEFYRELMEDEHTPMFNRALSGTYAPGSTFKPVTALCALDSGIIDTNTTYCCVGVFSKYADAGYAPACWINPGQHGDMNVVSGIENSCNYFFYSVADAIEGRGSIDLLCDYANRFGLGEYTGIELDEEKGAMASREYKKSLFPDDEFESQWFTGNTLAAAIGQSISLFTPMQLANYAAAIANGGTVYKASLLKSVRTFDNSSTVYERRPEVLYDNTNIPKEYYDAVRMGMNLVVTSGVSSTVHRVFNTASYTAAAKTGTAQVGEDVENNACFICFAPYENPEIAVAVVMEKGGAGSELAQVAREVLDYYFNFKDSTSALETENALLD